MILCLSCKRLWPNGTTWCGHCRRTLGTRYCPEGHPSPISAAACTVCGSTKLTPATQAINFRFLTWVILALVGTYLTPGVLELVHLGCVRLWRAALTLLLPPLATFGIWSVVLAPVVGERGRRVISDAWIGLFNMAFRIMEIGLRLCLRLVSRRPSLSKTAK